MSLSALRVSYPPALSAETGNPCDGPTINPIVGRCEPSSSTGSPSSSDSVISTPSSGCADQGILMACLMPLAVSVTAKSKSPQRGGSCSMSAGADHGRGGKGDGQSSLMLETPSAGDSSGSPRTAKGRSLKRAPSVALVAKKEGLHLLLGAHFARGIPHAASLFAIGRGLRCRHVSGESRASEGKCQGQRERRNERFHGRYSLRLYGVPGELRSRATCSCQTTLPETPMAARRVLAISMHRRRRRA